MSDSLRALLANVIDYAGLFPPAKLPLNQSADNYIRYVRSPRAWMVGGFVCPAAQLASLAKQPALSKLTELNLSLVAAPAESLAAAKASLRTDLELTREFVDEVATTYGVQVRLAIEWRLPPDAVEDESGIPKAVDAFPADIAMPLEAIACEVPLAAAERHAQSLASFQWRTNVKLGLKFRTGGLEAVAFPTSAALAQAFASCLKFGAPWKCTAGLHHPLPRWDATVNARMHGFVNVLAASTLGSVHKLESEPLQLILDDESPEHFAFSDKQLTWANGSEEFSASIAQIEAAHDVAMSSFGSCSCEEPWDDLAELGWMT